MWMLYKRGGESGTNRRCPTMRTQERPSAWVIRRECSEVRSLPPGGRKYVETPGKSEDALRCFVFVFQFVAAVPRLSCSVLTPAFTAH